MYEGLCEAEPRCARRMEIGRELLVRRASKEDKIASGCRVAQIREQSIVEVHDPACSGHDSLKSVCEAVHHREDVGRLIRGGLLPGSRGILIDHLLPGSMVRKVLHPIKPTRHDRRSKGIHVPAGQIRRYKSDFQFRTMIGAQGSSLEKAPSGERKAEESCLIKCRDR